MRIHTLPNGKVDCIYYLDDKKEGWTEVESIPEPEEREGYMPVMYYRNGQIEYEYEPIPPMPEPEPIPEPPFDYDAEVEALIAERYTVKQELAVQRQRESKPEEFKAYNDYCEECKAKVKSKMIQ